ncbi:MAG: hypothetical protein ABI639_11805 [Thermoanaerobaculia bacterium]
MRRLPATVVVFLLTLGLYAATTHRRVFIAGNDASRWAAIESLVDYGSASVERSRFAANIDRVRIGAHDYSNKPPLLALVGAGLYAAVQAVTGWTLHGPGAAAVLFWVTLLLIGVPGAWLVATFYRSIDRWVGLERRWRILLTLALAAGTLLFTFSTTLNNHTPAAALLFAAAIAAIDGEGGRCGTFVGLAAAIDLLPGLGFLPVFGWILLRSERRFALRRFVVAVAGCLVVAVLANLATHGSPLPVKLVPGAIDLSAQAGPAAGGVVLPQSPFYALEILAGSHGLLTVSPVLLFGLWGLIVACRRSDGLAGPARSGGGEELPAALHLRSIARAVAIGMALQFVGHALLAGSYGGWSYGYRYLLPMQPLLLFFAPLVLTAERVWPRRLFAGLLPASILFAALGAYHPWPPAFEQEGSGNAVAMRVTNPIGGNAAGWLAEHFPESAAARSAARRFVSSDVREQRAYFRLFFGSKGDLSTMRRFEP